MPERHFGRSVVRAPRAHPGCRHHRQLVWRATAWAAPAALDVAPAVVPLPSPQWVTASEREQYLPKALGAHECFSPSDRSPRRRRRQVRRPACPSGRLALPDPEPASRPARRDDGYHSGCLTGARPRSNCFPIKAASSSETEGSLWSSTMRSRHLRNVSRASTTCPRNAASERLPPCTAALRVPYSFFVRSYIARRSSPAPGDKRRNHRREAIPNLNTHLHETFDPGPQNSGGEPPVLLKIALR